MGKKSTFRIFEGNAPNRVLSLFRGSLGPKIDLSGFQGKCPKSSDKPILVISQGVLGIVNKGAGQCTLYE